MKLLGALGIDWKIFLIQVLNFLILFFILKWLFFDKFILALKKEKARSEAIQQGEKEIQKRKEEIEKEREDIIRKAKEKTKQILEEGEEISQEEKERILKRTEEEVGEILKEAKERAGAEVEKIKYREKAEVKDKTKETIRKVLSSAFSEDLHRKYIEEAVKELKNFDFGKIKGKEIISVTVISAVPLRKEEKKAISTFLFLKLKNPHFQEKIDKELIAGIKILIDGFSIDGTLKRKIEEAVEMNNFKE